MLPNDSGLDTTEGTGATPSVEVEHQPSSEPVAETPDPTPSPANPDPTPDVEPTTIAVVPGDEPVVGDAAPTADVSHETAGDVITGDEAAGESAPADGVESAPADAGEHAPADVVEGSPADAGEGAPVDAGGLNFAEALENADLPKPLARGELVEGVITATSPTQITVEVSGKGEGVIGSSELEKMSRQTLQSLKVGETIRVYIVNPHDPRTGNMVLSILRAMEENDWQTAETYRQNQEVYNTQIAGYNKGGLIVRFGRLRGFVPQSQMSADRRRALNENTQEAWAGMVNQPIVIKVMEVDRARNRLILSERLASRESREKRKADLIEQLTPGEKRTGRVVSLEEFGAFVDIGGAEGLIHLTEMSYQHINHPRDVLKVGQDIDVEVISVDPAAKRIGLSMKRMLQDPWDRVATTSFVGQLVQGTVTKLTKFGAFAQLVQYPEIEGLIHISELSEKRVLHPREVVNEGDELTLRVVKIDVKERRLGLSLKRVNSAEYLDLDWGN